MGKEDENKKKFNNGKAVFNFDKLRLSQNFSEIVGVKKALLTVPVRKPNRQEFIRIRPGEEWRFETAVLELKQERETYLIDSELWNELPGEIIPKVLFTTINRQGTLTLWPVKLPDQDGRHDQWSRSALEAAKIAESHWVRVAANMNLGAYEVFEATGDISEPTWPDVDFVNILEIAFKDKIIRSMDHPVINQLRGAL
jgi:hypothetical protein